MNDSFEVLDNSSTGRKEKLLMVLNIMLAASMLTACAHKSIIPPEHGPTGMAAAAQLPPVGALDVGETGSMASYLEGGGQQGAAPAEAENQIEEKEYQPAYAVVQEGEGVLDALRRASGAEPHQISPEQIVEILHIGDPNDSSDDWVEVYSWPALLRMNPSVKAGDQIKDTITPVLSAAYEVAPENRHLE